MKAMKSKMGNHLTETVLDKSSSGLKMEKDQRSESKRKTLIWTIAVLFIGMLGGVFYFISENDQLQEESLRKEAELQETLLKIASLDRELDLKIKEVEELGGDVEELIQIQWDLEDEKNQILVSKNKELALVRENVEGYENLLKQMDKQLVQLWAVRLQMISQIIGLKEQRIDLNRTILELNKTQKDLERKVQIASRLQAENIKITAISRTGKFREETFKNRQINKLKIEFNIDKNDVALKGAREIMIQITDPDGNILFDVETGSGTFILAGNKEFYTAKQDILLAYASQPDPEGNILFDLATGSGTFIMDGKEEFYTAKQDILFDNSGQKLNYLYDKGSDYSSGLYQVEVYSDGFVIGWSNFTVK